MTSEPRPDTPLEETVGALDTSVREGKALYVGVSSYYSMFNRWIEDELLNVLAEEGIGCITFSPLAQGLLIDKYLDGVPEGSLGALENLEFSDEELAAIDQYATESGINL